jgi:hypothetical protein
MTSNLIAYNDNRILELNEDNDRLKKKLGLK